MVSFLRATNFLAALVLIGASTSSSENAAFGFVPSTTIGTSSFALTGNPARCSRHNGRQHSHHDNHAFSLPNRQRRQIPFLPPSAKRRPIGSRTVRMLVEPGGRDALVELTTTDSPYSKTVRKAPKRLRQIASIGAVPAAAIAGFVLTPSRRMVAHGVGGAIAGIAGTIGKSRLDVETEENVVKPALAQLLLDNVDDLGGEDLPGEVQQLKTDYGVSDDDFMELAMDVYKRYLMAMAKNPMTKTTDIAELTNLSNALGLDNIAIGEAHAQAAADTYRATCTWTPEEELDDPEHPDRMSLDKLLFLSERAFRHNGETDEAFVFEFGRVAKAFNVTPAVAMRRVNDVAEPFYERALETTRTKLDTGAVNSDMLARARATLGISDRAASDMHLSTYADEVRSLLGVETEGVDPATCQFPEGALDRLEKLREVLEISDKDASYEMSVEVTPLFQATATEILKEVTNSTTGEAAAKPDVAALWSNIVSRQKDLCLSDEAMAPLLDSVVIQALGTPLEEASTFASVNNEGGVYNRLLDAVKIKDAVTDLLDQSSTTGGTVYSIDKCYDPNSDSACFAFLGPDMRKKLYQMFLSRIVRDSDGGADLTDETDERLAEVRTMLGIDDRTAGDVTTLVCGPILERALKASADEVTGEDSTPELVQNLKEKNEKLVTNLKVPDDLLLRYKREIYKNYLRFVQQNTPSGIPSSDFAAKLSTLADLLSLDESETAPMQVATFGQTYKKSVLEAMGATGIILPEYREALDKLRVRLGVGEEEAKKLFKSAVSDKMVPMVKRVEAELERALLTKEQLAQKRGKDAGEDVFRGGPGALGQLGIGTQGNVMGDIMNLVDFYTENDIPVKKEVGKRTVERKVTDGDGDGEEKTVEEEEPVYEMTYPITAIGVKAIEPEMAEAMYRQFVVGGFTAQGAQAARYEEAAPVFGGILGLPKGKMEEISGSVGSTVYENFIENAMKTKSALDQQDMMFLANIQGKLGLSSEQGEKMLIDAQKKVLNDQAQNLFTAERVSAADVKAFRDKCNAMGMDLSADLGISKGRIAGLFGIELGERIDRGEITPESADELTDIQESFGLTPEECEKALEGLVEKRVPEAVDRIDKELLRGREENCIDPIKTIIKFAAFVGGDVDVDVREERANKIVSIFAASDFGDAKSDVIDSQMELLKTTLGLK